MKTTGIFGFIVFAFLCSDAGVLFAQPITGVWKGKIRSTRLELKLVKKGDSLVGTSYYYESKNNYRRYSVRGYFDDKDNSVVWWDDVLLEDQTGSSKQGALMMVADFNCPGEGVMKLEGESSRLDDREASKAPVNLQKTSSHVFDDEWDYVLDNYTRGASNSYVIDSVAMLAFAPAPANSVEETGGAAFVPVQGPVPQQTGQSIHPAISEVPLSQQPDIPLQVRTSTPEEKFSSRVKKLESVIPIEGDSLDMRFYDDGDIDGDSIAVFLNGRMMEEHIFLTDQPHTIKVAVSQLADDNELVMVAENLGSIPPNTSLMIVMVAGKRYEARLYADEHSSAMVRFVKK
ncbi:MAG TPA: hypothetical protein VMI35_06885 [Puia sp.]|nr:hypothetical protein [Puia sp.]